MASSKKKPEPSKMKAMQKTVRSVGASGLMNSATVAKSNKNSKPVTTGLNAEKPKLLRATPADFKGSAAQVSGMTYGEYEVMANRMYREKYNAEMKKMQNKIKSNARKINSRGTK